MILASGRVYPGRLPSKSKTRPQRQHRGCPLPLLACWLVRQQYPFINFYYGFHETGRYGGADRTCRGRGKAIDAHQIIDLAWGDDQAKLSLHGQPLR